MSRNTLVLARDRVVPYPEGPARTPNEMVQEAIGPLADKLFGVPSIVAGVKITVFFKDERTPMSIAVWKKGQRPTE